jgi:phosphate transport system substrate-binding protein
MSSKNTKRSVGIVVAVIVIVAAIAGGYYFTSTPESTHNVAATAVENSVSIMNTATSATGQPMALSGTLNGAGSTLVFPLMSEWTFAFSQVYPNAQVNYQSIGSGGGIAQITAGTVNFGASDAPLSAAQYAALPATVVTIPESISAVVPAYNLPGIKNGLKFTGDVLARIFLANITNWDDPAIAALNPGVNLPNHAITVVHRSDGSGTMYAFTNYLTDSNQVWATHVGYSITPNWPTGLGCKGNEGVAGCIENTQYSIGPLEIAYAIENPSLISYGAVRNAAGNFILANQTNISAAVQAGASAGLPAGNAVWTHVSIINNIFNDTSATDAYPITTFTYLVAYQTQTNQADGTLLVNFLWWVVNNAQQAGVKLGYIPLPANVVTLDDTTIQSITYNGTPLYSGS